MPDDRQDILALIAAGRLTDEQGAAALNKLTIESLKPTFASEAGRIATQTLEGAAALPDIIAEKTGLSSIVPGGASVTRAAERFGVPIGQRPETEIGQFVGDVGELMGAGAIPAGMMARGQALGPVIASEVGAGLGGALGKRVDDSGVGEVVGAVAGSLTPAGFQNLVRMGFRGSQKEAEEAFKTLEGAGVTPTPLLVAEKGGARQIASAVKLIPGGGKINASIAKANEQIGKRLDEVIDKADVSPETVGRVVQRGIVGEAGFVNRFKQTADKLYKKITIADDAPTGISNTKATLDELAPTIEGAEGISDILASPTVRAIREAAVDIDELPFKSLQKLRSEVGAKLAGVDLVSDIPRAELKRLYGALSDDLKAAADAAGLGKEFSRANNFYKGGIKRIDDVLDGIQKKVPEKILSSLLAGGKEGATQIRALRKSLTPDEWTVVAKGALKKLGQETGGQADEFGVGFSAERLLTGLNNMSNKARASFFGGVKGINKNDIDALAKSAAILRKTKRAGFNPSQTAQANAKVGIITALSGGGGVGLAVGSLYPASAAVLTMIGANGSARLLTNPSFAKWLVRSSSLPQSLVASHIARLTTIADRNPDIAPDIKEFISVLENE